MADAATSTPVSPLADSLLRRLPPEVLGEIVFHLHGFQASDKFAGARAGRVFKVGDLGLGYYVDNWQPTSTALLALAATCTETRAGVLPALLPLAKLKLRFARDVVLQEYSSPMRCFDLTDAASGGPMGRQRRAEKFAKLCGLKEAARAVGDEAKFKKGDVVTMHGLSMGLTKFNGKRGIVGPGRSAFRGTGLCAVSLYEPVDSCSGILVNEANLSK